jgi:hypothetical protein
MNAAVLVLCLVLATEAFASEKVIKDLPTDGPGDFYVFNREPLLPNALAKLPIGSITPKGWLRGQLDLMKDGMTGHLDEISKFITPESGWWNGENRGWEEMPYWLKGFGDLGYVLDDRDIKIRARKWLDAVIAGQQDDGYFGPPENKAKKDLWPNMVMLFAFQSLHETTGDKRIIPLMTEYFRYQNSLPTEDLIPESWQKIRAGDNLESIYWLYNHTGEPWLLDLAKKLHERTADWTNSIPSPHGVNFCQSFRQPGVFYQQSRDKKHLDAVERNYAEVIGEYGQAPGGMFGADENWREGKTGAQQAAETCSIVEFMYSDESLLRITGDPKYADRCEDVAFNSFPASMTPDLKALHYLTAPNQVSCDKDNHCYQNQGTMVSYSPHSYRCCQHNVAQGWPYYAEHLWMATKGNGLAAMLYAVCEVKAKVGNGTEVRIIEETDYPFDQQVNFTIHTPKAVEFPLALRIPGWCKDARVTLNGRNLGLKTKPASYVVLNRQWQEGDKVSLELPMVIEVKTWEKQSGGISVNRGPLSYSLKIGEKWQKYGGTDEWPEWEILPTSPWNYGLIPDSIEVARHQPVANQPFTPDAAPITLKAKARRVPEWTLEMNCPASLPKSPVTSTEPIEELELVPMGCARLRISVFPVIAPRSD